MRALECKIAVGVWNAVWIVSLYLLLLLFYVHSIGNHLYEPYNLINKE